MAERSDPTTQSVPSVDQGRRAMLRGIPAAGVALGAVVAGSEAKAAEPTPPSGHTESGYSENDHIRRYYQLSRF